MTKLHRRFSQTGILAFLVFLVSVLLIASCPESERENNSIKKIPKSTLDSKSTKPLEVDSKLLKEELLNDIELLNSMDGAEKFIATHKSAGFAVKDSFSDSSQTVEEAQRSGRRPQKVVFESKPDEDGNLSKIRLYGDPSELVMSISHTLYAKLHNASKEDVLSCMKELSTLQSGTCEENKTINKNKEFRSYQYQFSVEDVDVSFVQFEEYLNGVLSKRSIKYFVFSFPVGAID